MRKWIPGILVALFLLSWSSPVWAVPPMPFRIGGTLHLNGEQITRDNDTGYVVLLTHQDVTPFSPVAEDSDGLSEAYDWYRIDIPIYDREAQPHGTTPGSTVVIHLFKDGVKQIVTRPAGGHITVRASGETLQVDIEAWSMASDIPRLYTPQEVEGMIQQAVQDALLEQCQVLRSNSDGKIGLEEAIRALQVVSGF